MSFFPAKAWWFFLVSYFPWPENSKAKHLPQIAPDPPGTEAKAKPTLSHPSIVNGAWLKQVVDTPQSQRDLEYLSERTFWFTSHSLASFPHPALSLHEQNGLQK